MVYCARCLFLSFPAKRKKGETVDAVFQPAWMENSKIPQHKKLLLKASTATTAELAADVRQSFELRRHREDFEFERQRNGVLTGGTTYGEQGKMKPKYKRMFKQNMV